MLTIAILMVQLLISCLSFIFENIKCRENVRPPARGEDKVGLGGLSPPANIEISPPPEHDGRSSATYELPQNIYSAIQILIVVCTVVFFCTHTHAVHTALVCSTQMQKCLGVSRQKQLAKCTPLT